MYRNCVAILLLSILAILGSSSAEAASFGRVTITVKSADGATLPGVEITAICPEIKFSKVLTTNKKGRATLSVPDPTKRYGLQIVHEGFQPKQVAVKPEVGSTTKTEIVLDPEVKREPAPTEMVMTEAHTAFNEGVEAMRAGDSEAASSQFLKALELDPDLASAHLALANVYLEAGDLESGLVSVKRTLELDSENVLAYRILYELENRSGNEDEAKRILAILARIDQSGDAAAIIFNEGAAAFRVGDTKTAEERFLKALEIDPNLAVAMKGLAGIYARQEAYKEAAEMAERYLALDPQDAATLRLRWEVYRTLEDKENEERAFKALAAVDTDVMADDLLRQAAKLFDEGQVEAATSGFEKVLALKPDHGPAHYHLALCLIGADEGEQAKLHLQKFLEISPDHPEASYARDMLSYLQ